MAITRNTPWRAERDVPYEFWRDTIAAARNPNGTGERADPELASLAAYNAAKPHTALALAKLVAESSLGTDFDDNPRSNKNPFNLKSPTYDGTYVKYLTWIGGVKGWHDRITSPTYNTLSNPGVYARTTSIADLIHVFAPTSENETERYIAGVVQRMNAYPVAVETPSTPEEPVATWQSQFDLMFGKGWRITQDWAAYGGPDLYEYGDGHGLDGSQHTGIDVGIPYGTKLFAPAAATVVCGGTGKGPGANGQGCDAFNDWGDGDSVKQGVGRIELLFENGQSLIYGHSRASTVKPGDKVTRGQQIGTSGGMFGAHTHLEARKFVSGDYQLFDPKTLLESLPVAGGTQPPMATPATLDYSSLSFPVEVRLVPSSHTHQRTGIPMDPDWSTWHDTGNPSAGADADSHDDWIMAGCPDENGDPTDTSWHFTVDDGKAIQHLPLNEVAWHAGDKATGPGNRTSLAIEECVNSDRNAAKTRANAAELHAFLIRKLGLKGGTIAALVQHNKWNGKDCPHVIRSQGLWPNVQAQVAARLAAPAPGPDPVPPKPPEPDIVPGVDWGIAKRAFDNPDPELANYKLTKGGPLSTAYLERAKQTGKWPQLTDRWPYENGARVYYRFSNGDLALFTDADKKIRWIGEAA